MHLTLAAADGGVTAEVGASRLVVAAAVAIVAIIVLITWLKWNPFLALMTGSLVLALGAGVGLTESFTSFTEGFGSTLGGVGVLIGLGALIGKLLMESGGANAIVDKILGASTAKLLPWSITLVAFIVGIPMFFEIGLVLLVPIIMLTARRANVPVLLVGIPVLAGLGQLHALMAPHPGPLVVIDALGADLGRTMLIGFIVAIPTIIAVGPVFAPIAARWVPVKAPVEDVTETSDDSSYSRPSFLVSTTTILLPVVLMLGRTVAEVTLAEDNRVREVLDFLGTPVVALFITAALALVTFGTATGRDRNQVGSLVSASFGPVAGILLIVGAGGGFKQTLVNLGVGDVVADTTDSLSLSPLVVAFVLAALVRVATGSATVAAVTAAGLVVPLLVGLSPTQVSLMALAVGSGSGFLSHVNDAGFWMIKEFFGLTVAQTFKTWTVMTVAAPVVSMVIISALWVVL